MDLRRDVERLDHATALDGPVDAVRVVARTLLPAGPLKDVLHGTWLGHPAHPMLTDVPIGCWTSAFLVDVLGGRRGQKAADRLIAIGVLAALPTAATGLADWTELDRRSARTGLVHAAANSVALACYTASLVARRRGRRAKGLVLSLLGAGAVTAGGYLGGHLSYRRAAGVSRDAFEEFPRDWVVVFDAADIPEGKPVAVHADGARLFLYREGPAVHALSAVCPHQGGPLDEGEIVHADTGGRSAPVVVCPWHGSRFRVDDGEVLRGPSASPAPAFDVRVDGGKVAVRRRIG
jgi:nitrite reductase/ring-hydroxylating ferredoxin subunit/uncharacterized membrane protein